MTHRMHHSPMILYVKQWCPWCIEAIDYLDRHGFDYEVCDVLANPDAYARMRKISRQSLTPTMDVDGKILADFDVGQLSAFLAEHAIKP